MTMLLSGVWLVFVLNIMLLWIYLHSSHYFHWFDQPNEARKIHTQAIPTSAGLVFMAPVVLAFLLFPNGFPEHAFVIGLVLLLLLVLGGIDDFKHISVALRLFVVSCACGVFLYYFYAEHDIHFILLGLYFFGLLWWLNLFNFMDGADGMAVLHALVSACGYLLAFALLAQTELMLLPYLILFIVCLLSFLLFNYPKAKMFMGDSGSFSVSFLLAVMALFGLSEGIFDQMMIISFHLVFIVDATLTLLARLIFKHRLSQAHNLHLFQALIDAGHSHALVSMWYALVTICTVAIALLLVFWQLGWQLRLLILLLQAGILTSIWFKYHNKTKFERFLR